MVDKDRELGMRNKDNEREIEAIRIKTSKEKGVGHTEVSQEGVGERLGTGHERREERREERQEHRQEHRQEKRQERREDR
jgi:hypothetical protein